MSAKELQTAVDLLGKDIKPVDGAPSVAIYNRTPLKSVSRHTLQRTMPSDAALTAHELFSVLRELDARSVKLIWIESVPDDMAWDGVRDRLQRASAG
jgi:L-threonylcarbamoyladenylate synthase